MYIPPALPHPMRVPTMALSGTYVHPPLLCEILLPPPPGHWYRMCGNVATVKYIRTSGRGTEGDTRKNWQRVPHSNLDGTRSASRFTSAQNSRKRGPRENCVHIWNGRPTSVSCDLSTIFCVYRCVSLLSIATNRLQRTEHISRRPRATTLSLSPVSVKFARAHAV